MAGIFAHDDRASKADADGVHGLTGSVDHLTRYGSLFSRKVAILEGKRTVKHTGENIVYPIRQSTKQQGSAES